MQSELLTVQQFCERYGAGRTRCFALLASGQIEAKRFGARTLIVAESARRWAASLPKWQSTRPVRQAVSA